MLIAMAYVMVNENLYNQTFLDTYTVGFDRFRNYILGVEEGVPKTPLWAEKITGVSANVIKNLAWEYATTKPAALIAGIGPGRTAYGEQYHRAAKTLAAMTGNIGIHGGWAGRSLAPASRMGGFDFRLGKLPRSKGNPVDLEASPRKDALMTREGGVSSARIHFSELPEALLKGKEGGYAADLKMLMVMQSNPINQYPNTNRMIQGFQKLEFIAVAEQVMTATAAYADILLPVCTFMERNDLSVGGATPIFGYIKKVIDPLYESKTPLDICKGLAERLGVSIYSEKTEEEWIKELLKTSFVPDIDHFKEKAIYRLKYPEPRVAFKEQIEDLQNHPFPTPSGKIEIYSQKLADMNNSEIPPIPKYIEAWESRNDPLTAKYPLQLITTHSKRRANSQFERVPWLRELLVQVLSINPVDAVPRGIQDGDEVRVFNARGEIIVPVKITERIMPGVVDLPQGAWYRPDERGVDRGGCANVLTKDVCSPSGAGCFNTCLVQVEKV
jgi:anaerobic dimethyl sulfoxide reductase subunit A